MSKVLTEKVMGDWYPFLTLGVSVFILSWLFFLGDIVAGR
jgi:hypothetical protein